MFKNIINTLIIVFALGLAGVVQSADNSVIANEFNACTGSADGEVTISENGESSDCCSKSLGYCISCSHSSCVKMPYSISRPVLNNLQPNNTVFALPTPKHPSLRDQMRPYKTRILAPVKAIKPVKKLNTLRDRMKQTQMMKSAPAKAAITGKAPTVKKAVKQYQPLKARALTPNKVISK